MHKSFTVKSKVGIKNVLETPVDIISNSGNKLPIIAIWDTGATNCAITTNVVSALGLVPTGKAVVHTGNGTVTQNTFTIDVLLPNNVVIPKITATEVPGLSGGSNALIGMDVINLGDFSITNHKGTTCMSFRLPSGHIIDYANHANGVVPANAGKPNWLKPSSGSYKKGKK